jgi:hypothetical protein
MQRQKDGTEESLDRAYEIWEYSYKVMQGTSSVGNESADVEVEFPKEKLCLNIVTWVQVRFVSVRNEVLAGCYFVRHPSPLYKLRNLQIIFSH